MVHRRRLALRRLRLIAICEFRRRAHPAQRRQRGTRQYRARRPWPHAQQHSQLAPCPRPRSSTRPTRQPSQCCHATQNPLPVRFRPAIPDSPITQAVPLPLVGSPATATAQPLAASGWVSLSDSNGFTSLMVAAVDPADWPPVFRRAGQCQCEQLLRVRPICRVRATRRPRRNDRQCRPRTLLWPFARPRHRQLRRHRPRRIRVHLGTDPLSSGRDGPGVFPTGPTSLPRAARSNSRTAAATPISPSCLIRRSAGRPLFGVVAQGQLADPDVFNLLLVFNPSSGASGVSLPVLVEQFPNLSLSNIESKISAASDLIHVVSFEEAQSQPFGVRPDGLLAQRSCCPSSPSPTASTPRLPIPPGPPNPTCSAPAPRTATSSWRSTAMAWLTCASATGQTARSRRKA